MRANPIQNLESFDIVGVRKDGGVDLVITCGGPLDNSVETLAALRQKVENYVLEVEAAKDPTFFEQYGLSPNAKITIYLSCAYEIHPDVMTVVAELQSLVDRIGASIGVVRGMGSAP